MSIGNITLSSVPVLTDTSEGRATWNPKTRLAQISLPFSPMTVNSMYRMVSHGRKTWMTISARGKVWKQDAMEILTPLQAHYPEDELIRVDVMFWYHTRRLVDCDNVLKPLLDVLQQVPPESIVDDTPEWHNWPIIHDDKQIQELSVARLPFDEKRKNGEVWIDIRPVRQA